MSTENIAATPGNRSDFVQAMRFLAAAMVLYAHHTFYFNERLDSSLNISTLGPDGVALFFVISGIVMVVSTQKLPLNSIGAKEFMIRRLLRIVPLYWLATFVKIGIAVALPQMVHHNSFDLVHAIKSLFFIPTFNAGGQVTPILGVGWTLIHEMYFYLIFSAAMILGLKPALWTSIFIIGVCGYGALEQSTSAPMIMATNPINIYFIIGMLIGTLLTTKDKESWWIPTICILLVGVAAAKWIDSRFLWPYINVKPVVFLLSAAMLLFYAMPIPHLADLTAKLGDSSYALYLFHTFFSTPLLLLIHKLPGDMNPWVEIWISTLISIWLGYLAHKMVEKPLNKAVAKVFGRKA